MNRRTAIIYSLVGVSVLPLSCQIHHEEKNRLLGIDQFAAIWEEKTIFSVGEAYIHNKPESTVHNIKNELEVLRKNGDLDSINATKLLENKIQSDFNTEKMVIVNGWIISETEAKLCAMYYLENI